MGSSPVPELEKHEVAVDAASAGVRLDRVLASALPALSRMRVKALIQAGLVSRDGATISEPSNRVKPGETYAVVVPPAADPTPQGQKIPLHIVYEDDDLIVVDKRAGLVVHPAPGNPDRTLVNALIHHCGESLSGIGGVRRPGIVHRLDKDTSGLIVAAKSDHAHQSLARQFAERSIERAYVAVVWGVPQPLAGEIDAPIGRNPHNRRKMAVVQRGGKRALTRYRVQRRLAANATIVGCRLATGRTHQIRVHLAHTGTPVVGDRLYGRARQAAGASPQAQAIIRAFERQALHAELLGFLHPGTGQAVRFESELPVEMKELISVLERLK
jgi:23S rRNA pseudouridine1911/1915/1917 synthase